jgi:predicted RNA methylase
MTRTGLEGSDHGTVPARYGYTADSARLYGSLGIEGTTYQIGFDAVRELLGPVEGKVLLDFGCGAGRSTAFLKALGAPARLRR